MKKYNVHHIGGGGGLYLFSNVIICGPVIAYLENKKHFGNLTLSFALF